MTVPQLQSRKWKDDDIVFLFSIMYWSGLRGGEAIKLEKKDFNTRTRRITLHDTKTKVVEKAIIPMTFVAETQEYLKTKSDGQLFPGLKYLTLYRWMKKLGKVLQVPAWTTPRKKTGELTVCHAMRKSIGKNLIAGVHLAPDGGNYSIIEVSKLLRHKKPSMTEEHYLKISDESLMRRY
jgi:integrase